MKSILHIVLLSLLALVLAVFLFLYSRPCDYSVGFTTDAKPDVVYYHLLNWRTWNRKQQAQIKVRDKHPVSHMEHRVVLPDTLLDFRWEIKNLDDSLTKVSACVSDPGRKLKNRLTARVLPTAFKKSVQYNVLDIMRKLESMRETFDFSFEGPAKFEARHCVYMSVRCPVRQKAHLMIATVSDLNQFVRQNELGLDGDPFLLIHNWELGDDSVFFDFCFPVQHIDAIPFHPQISYRYVEEMQACKSVFHGNYSISDISWLNLAKGLEEAGHSPSGTLIEVYLNDPHSGGNELEWKAEIFLGIAKPSAQ